MSKLKLINNVRMMPGRQVVSKCKQHMHRDIFPVKGELSVFSSYLDKLC